MLSFSLGSRRLVLLSCGTGIVLWGRLDTGCPHHSMQGDNCFWRGSEVTGAVPHGDQKGCPSLFILAIPDGDVGAVRGEEVYHFGAALVGRAVHGGFAVLISGVDVGAECQQQFDRFEGLWFGAGGLVAVPDRANACGCHERRAVVDIGEQRVRTQLDQQVHQPDIGGLGCEQERCCIGSVETGPSRGSLRMPRIHIGSALDELAHELQAGQFSRPDGGRIAVTTKWLSNPSDGVQRGKTGALIIWIGPGLKQSDCQIEVSVFDGED